MTLLMREKVLVYATWQGRLLVFREPDFPDVPLQVPGGTVEPREEPAAAARRELAEESGITDGIAFSLLGRHSVEVAKAGGQELHHRSFFHVELNGSYPEIWRHREDKPDGGGDPILFELFWLPMPEASAALGGGLGACLPQLWERLGVPA